MLCKGLLVTTSLPGVDTRLALTHMDARLALTHALTHAHISCENWNLNLCLWCLTSAVGLRCCPSGCQGRLAECGSV